MIRSTRSTRSALLLALLAFAVFPVAVRAQGRTHVLLAPTEMTWGNAPASLPSGAKAAVIEGDPAAAGPFTMRLQLPDGYRVPPHFHPAIEHVTVISGKFTVGTGARGDFAEAKALTAGGFMMMPAGSVHHVRAEGETVIQVHRVGPWGITYSNPADDPRGSPPAPQVPAGLQVRLDKSVSASDPDDAPDVTIASVGRGFQVTTGPAAVVWNPANTARGAYTLKGKFTLQKPSGHNNYYGLIFGGRDLDGPKQAYVYFLVSQNGTYTLRRRVGDAVTDIQARVAHASIQKPDANGRSVNAVEVRVAGNTVSYVINGTVVHTMPKDGTMADGLAGVRVNHQLDVQVDGFTLQKS